ncbi:MAG: alpha-amylase [Bacteroidetes bacterium]|nr:MAG: alpha-amylase [Bacteroidota bacterium]
MKVGRILQQIKQNALIALLMFNLVIPFPGNTVAQIWQPEGLNMPGVWNSWTNPPVNRLALASSTQVPGGRVAKIPTGTPRYQTIFSVAASGADLIGGTYPWLFTSGSSGNPWSNKWANVTVTMNSLQSYSYNTGTDNQITVVNGKWYTMNWEDSGYTGTRAIFMETSAQPVEINSVSVPLLASADSPVTVSITLSGLKSPEEMIYLRYTTDAWVTSGIQQVTITGNSGTAIIPGQPGGTVISCYALSSTITSLSSNFDLQTIKLNNNGGGNYTIPVGNPTIGWANLQWPGSNTIEPGQPFNVYGQVWINGLTGGLNPAPGLQAWIGYSDSNTNPSTWTNWIAAGYNGASGSNDEFVANIGSVITTRDTFYYATRYKLNDQAYVYGGYAPVTGGFWNGTTNISGVLIVGHNIDCGTFSGIISSDPVFPVQNQPVTLYFDATAGNGALVNYTGDVYAHTGVITNLSNGPADWKYIKTNWGQNTPETLLTRVDTNLYSLTINNPVAYYNVPPGETIEQLAFVFRSATAQPGGSYIEQRNSDGSDISVEIYPPALAVKFLNPAEHQSVLENNIQLPVCIEARQNTSLSLFINNNLLVQENNSSLSYMLIMQQLDPGENWLIAEASDGATQVRDSIGIYLRGPVQVAEMPAGVHNGINYINDSTVTLVLHDPAGYKQYAYAIGEFSNWDYSDENYMKRTPDGKHYWVTLSNLQIGQEYAYQYLIDGNLKIADPYCEKILDPWNDQWIPSTNYPGLKPYPHGKTTGIVSIFQTNSTGFQWQVPDFTPPALNNTQSDLLIYEMHIRDFVGSRSINEAKEKLPYLKELGVNAVQLMPISEFDGNDSWGFSPNFFFATDKAYGNKQAYQEFIDEAHRLGMAVIMDIVPNHAFGLNPMVQMYFDPNAAGGSGQPSASNPWLNGQAPHPYSVGYDFNHESPYTRQLFKDVFGYWLTEFKIDGFRVDLSKGLTQNYTTDFGGWNAYDQSRVNILTDYFNHIKWVNPNAYVILEHFANNDEQTVLANTGMLLWSAMHSNYKQVAMGWETSSDVSWAFHGNRGWNYPNLLDYMESHDEERMMYEALSNGNSAPNYNIRDTLTALHHQEQALVLFLGIPGPKMLWQFEEMGYDYSIFSNGGRTSPKPPRWDYPDNPAREKISRVISGMAALRKSDAFRYGNFTSELWGLGKRMWIRHTSMDVVITVNMGVTGFDMAPGFTKTGTWYDYFTGEAINVTNAGGHFFFYGPGEYRVFTSVPVPRPFFNMEITVVDSLSGNPIQGARVNLGNSGNRVTGADGKAVFLALPQANAITAGKFDWLSKTVNITVISDTSITIELAPGWDPDAGWVNLQWPGTGQINTGQDFNVHARAWIAGLTNQTTPPAGLEAWIGYSDTDTDPSTWTNWVVASYTTAIGDNDEFTANIGPEFITEGTRYYASRFRLDEGNYVYGGYSASGGGTWDGVNNVSGILNVSVLPPAVIGWANLQWPGSGQIVMGQDYNVYAQAWIDGITGQPTPAPGLEVWIGYNSTNTNPSTWTNWIPANYNLAVGNNDEFMANLGAVFTTTGTRYYASRFRLNNGSFVYGGYSFSSGGFWNGTTYISGVLTVNAPPAKTLNLTLFLEGLYEGNGLMRQARSETGPRYGTGIADLITLEFHNQSNYSIVEQSFQDLNLMTNGQCSVAVPAALSGSYYLTVKHRNSVATTSALPVSFTSQTIPYSFNAASAAFGNNLLLTSDGRYVIYGGDVNQDGSVDTGDMTPLDNDQFNFISGYVATDVNGDGSVDTGDVTIIDNNQFNFVGAAHP